jgi:poly-gamma-glutamate capsule biosynthesis protein CapA/YwtB (metallophosphatase superfamily)
MATSPEIAYDLASAGIDMVSAANNHTFDYGSIGVVTNLRNLARAEIVAAGAGEDLQRARAARYLHHPRGTVALISATSTFAPYGKASRSHPDMHGRPGLSPLTTHSHPVLEVPSIVADSLGLLARLVGYSGRRFKEQQFDLFGVEIRRGRAFRLRTGPWLDPTDRSAILQAITEASQKADLTIVAVHAHRQGEWLSDFAHQTIDAGADAFVAHGPHEIKSIEIYRGRPIFYSLGDFFYEQYYIERLPSEYYERAGLGDDATPQDAMEARFSKTDRREAWEGLGAIVEFGAGTMRSVRLIPLDLGFDEPFGGMRGRPRVASAELGRSIVNALRLKSKAYRTEIDYLPEENVGLIVLDQSCADGFAK